MPAPTVTASAPGAKCNAELVLGDPSISILEGVVLPWGEPSGYLRKVVLPTLAKAFKFDLNAPGASTAAAAQNALLHGAPGRTSSSPPTARRGAASTRASGKASSGTSSGATASRPATRCGRRSRSSWSRSRVRPAAASGSSPRACRCWSHGQSIGDVVDLPVDDAVEFFEGIPLRGAARPAAVDPDIAGPILKEVADRLRFLRDVGLEYLTLGRGAASLSGGETQRIRLATQIGSRLVGVLYILDEPSIGLHQRDNERLLETLRGLRDLGNTVIVVEHDEDTIRGRRSRDRPGPARRPLRRRSGGGGNVSRRSGSIPTRSPARYLRGELRIPVPGGRREAPAKHACASSGARANNLRNLTVDIPLGLFVAVTGVSGSGKSTLVTDILYQALARHFYRAKVVPGAHTRIEGLDQIDKVIDIDQSPDRPHAALESGDLHRTLHADPRALHPAARTRRCAATVRAASRST